jgi:hypothetical protein
VPEHPSLSNSTVPHSLLVNNTGKLLLGWMTIKKNSVIVILSESVSWNYSLNEGVAQIDFSGTVVQLMAVFTYFAAFISPNPKRGLTRKPAEFSCQSTLSYFLKIEWL